MTAATPARYGEWRSPIDARTAASGRSIPTWPAYVGNDVWWAESHPSEGGRTTLMRRTSRGIEDVLPHKDAKGEWKWNVRSRVIEYGGRAWAAKPAGPGRPLRVVFANYADQRLYAVEPDASDPTPYAITPDERDPSGEPPRYLLPEFTANGSSVRCLQEQKTRKDPGPTDVVRRFVSVPVARGAGKIDVLVGEDCHFLAGPLTSPDGQHLAWLGWDHPNMPWDGTELRVADISRGTAGPPRKIFGNQAAGKGQVSVVQAEWAKDGTLLVAADRTGWWNLYRIHPDRPDKAEPLWPVDEECGGPLWGLGFRWFAPLPDGKIVVLHGKGAQRLAVLDPRTRNVTPFAKEFEWEGFLDVHPNGRQVLGVAANASQPDAVTEVDLTNGAVRTMSKPPDPVPLDYLPKPEPREFTRPGSEGNVHAIVFPPRNPDHIGPQDEKPPYIAFIHGGPTARATAALDLTIAYFTSRGIGVVQVNYGGSTGYGREYRQRLNSQWGRVDVADTSFVVRELSKNHADPQRLGIRGGSAGGFTSAAALTLDAAETPFACGNIMYPVLDLKRITETTHDFEAKYPEELVPPDQFVQRSPSNHAKDVKVPFLILQGLQDPICPPQQCYDFLKMVVEKPDSAPPHGYIGFSGETHGFRKEDNIVAALQQELLLYGKVFGFQPALDKYSPTARREVDMPTPRAQEEKAAPVS